MTSILLSILTLAPALPVEVAPPPANPETFIPQRRHQPLPGTVVGVLVARPEAVLAAEGRSGPIDQLVLGTADGSYRWVYVPTPDKAPTISNLKVPVGQRPGETRLYPALHMATPATVQAWGIPADPVVLVEVEVNDGLGSPAEDAFVATRMKRLDDTPAFRAKASDILKEAERLYDLWQRDLGKEIDTAMDRAAKDAVGDRRPTGPRERKTLTFLTWLPDSQRIVVRFKTTVRDGVYSYGRGIAIDTGERPPPPGPPGGGAAPQRAEFGMRYGPTFGIDYGAAFEADATGRVTRTQELPRKAFQHEIPPPPAPRPVGGPIPPGRGRGGRDGAGPN